MKKLYILILQALILLAFYLLAPSALAQTNQIIKLGNNSKATLTHSSGFSHEVQKLRDQLINECSALPAESPFIANWLDDIARLDALQTWLTEGHEARTFPGRSSENTLELKSAPPTDAPGIRPEIPVYLGEEVLKLGEFWIVRPNNKQP